MNGFRRNPWSAAASIYRQAAYDSARFAILFRLCEALLFVPLAALVARWLMGRPVVDSTDLVSFALSLRGFVGGFLTLSLLVTIRLVEVAGLSAIAYGVLHQRRVTSPAALGIVLKHLPQLLSVACLVQLGGLLVLSPLLAITGIYATKLLAQHDINYYIVEWPTEFKMAIGIVVAIAIPTVAALVWLSVRWLLVVQTMAFEDLGATEALRASARLTRRGWWRSAGTLAAIGLLQLALGMLAWLFDGLCAWTAARLVGESLTSQFSVFAGLLVTHTVLTGAITLPGPCLAAAALTLLYRDLYPGEQRSGTPAWISSADAEAPSRAERRRARGVMAILPLGMLAVEIVLAVVALRDLYEERPVAVTAHRGATLHSIENTLDAIREAIDDGAQYAEIDVQMSRDGGLIVTHDSDFSRLAGVAKKVWELTDAEIAEITLRGDSSRGIPDAHAPTLDETLDAAHGRIRLNIELKYYGDHQPRLAERVVEAVRAKEMTDEVVIQSLHYEGLMEVRRAAPEIPIGYLFSVNARQPKRLDVDFLSVQISRVNAAFVRAAHRRKQEVHVWTVDKPGDMKRMIDLGVDNLITNRPREALALIEEEAHLDSAQIALRRLRAWLRE